jgi:hypothetical protein
MQRIVPFIVGALMLAGCATPYQKLGDTGGYLQEKLAEDAYRITFRGNGFTNQQRAHDFALLRAAEIGGKLGFSHFTIEGEGDCSRTTTVDLGSTSNTSGTAYGSGNSVSYFGTTTTHTNRMPVRKQGVILVVRYYEGTPAGRHLEVHSVSDTITSLESKYRLSIGLSANGAQSGTESQ